MTDGAQAEPGMDDVLASIRRILHEGEERATPLPTASGEDVLVLDQSMMVAAPASPALPAPIPAPEPTARNPAPTEPTPLVAPSVAAAAAGPLSALRQTVLSRGVRLHASGPTLEDMVRDELRPLLKSWLDAELPALVERVVRQEIERVVARA